MASHLGLSGLFDDEERPRYMGPPPQCVTCSRFVAVHDERTREIPEMGDYGTVLSVEFQCGRCVEARRR